MKVSILTPDLSHNCLGRAYLLAELLERNFEVEIIGPKLGDEIWSPLQGKYKYRSVNTSTFVHSFIRDLPELLKLITGDVILASKPQMQSYGVALLKKITKNHPIVLDIDDWESGFAYRRGKPFAYALGIPKAIEINSFYYNRVLECLSGFADARIVSNHFLQNKFGGELIPHVRDTNIFDPERFDKKSARREFDLPTDSQIVMFSGTPRPHKGVDQLIESIKNLDRDDVRVVLVGAQESNYVKKLRDLGGDSLIIRGQQPFDEIPKWIAAADIIAIPQKESSKTIGQLPAKVFDAMAMAKPIVATKVSDLPEVLDDCGCLVEPGSTSSLQNAISELLADKQLQDELGQKARQRCIKRYSYDAIAPRLAEVINQVSSK